MRPSGTFFRPVRLSLADLLGRDFTDAAAAACAALTGDSVYSLRTIGRHRVDFHPRARQAAKSRRGFTRERGPRGSRGIDEFPSQQIG